MAAELEYVTAQRVMRVCPWARAARVLGWVSGPLNFVALLLVSWSGLVWVGYRSPPPIVWCGTILAGTVLTLPQTATGLVTLVALVTIRHHPDKYWGKGEALWGYGISVAWLLFGWLTLGSVGRY